MLQIVLALLCAVLYLFFRHKLRTGTMLMDGMWFEFPRYMDETLIRNFTPLLEWQRNVKNGLLAQGAVLERVSIRDTYMFGSRIGFMLMDVTMYMDGVKLPGAVLLRGKSLAVLLWYRDLATRDVHVVLLRQPRVPTGRMTWEVPAGMADGTGTLKGQMFKEIEEETGLVLNVRDLVHYDTMSPYTSSGLLDETLELYSMQVSPDVITTADTASPLGNRVEGEIITNVVGVSLSDARTLARTMEDGKLRILLSMLEM